MASHPAKIGKYNVEGVLGRGGMGVVYKAVDPQIGRYVAIKMILSGGDQSLLERFRSEARSTGSLQCPNIVTVYDFGEHEGNPYLVMQFLEGSSLESMIQKGVQLTLSERLGIIIDVCNGLAYAHQRGVIHRDIKPANIMVLQDGVNDGMGVIVDFGIARIGGATRLTKTDQIIGSVHYMSVEQLQAKELDNRTDIYATGVVMFQLLTGALPFDAPETAATLLKIVNEPPPPLSHYLKEYPAELEAIVSRALAKKREDRYASAKDLAFDLMQVQEHLKSETVVQLVRRAEAALAREEWTRAREQLQQVLRIDRQNTQAQRLMNAVQEHLRQQQQIEQARALRSQADEAYMDQRYDDALRLLDQAVTLDPKNSDLQALRDSVRLSKERATGLRRALRRAEAALQDGDLDEAQSAVSEAFKIDPYDTQAKALKVIISQHAEERIRQQQLQKLLDQARNQIAARDLTEAFATLKAAEALDPTSNELQSVARMAVSAREQERRRAETEELRRQIETALVHEEYATAVAKAEEGLRKFPQEQSLLKLKALAEAQQARIELKKFVREQFATASSLADAGQLGQALAVLDRALQRAPGNSELETLRSTLQERIAAEESEQQRLRALDATLAEGRRIFQERGAGSAREFLDAHAAPFAEFPQVHELYQAVRAREALDVLDGRLASEPNPSKRVQLADEAARANPDNAWIRQRLADLQQIRAQISAAMDRAQGLEQRRCYSDAIREWRQLRSAYPQVPEFEAQIRRLASLEAERAKPAKPVASPAVLAAPTESMAGPAVLPELAGMEKPAARLSSSGLSATRMIDSPALPDAAPTRLVPAVEKPPTTKTEVARPQPKKIAPPPSPVPPLPKPARTDRRRQLENLLAGPRKFIAIAVGVVVLAVGGYLIFAGGKKKTVTVGITSDPAGVEVTVGGQKCTSTPCKVELPPGTYELLAQKEGFDAVKKTVTIAADMKPLPMVTLPPVAPAQGTLSVRGNVDDAEVYVDGTLRGLTADQKYEMNLSVGTHELILKKSGYKDSDLSRFEIAKGTTTAQSFFLKKIEGTVVEALPAYIDLASRPGATVTIDHQSAGTVPADGKLLKKVTPGSHSVEVSLNGYKPWSGSAVAESGKRSKLTANLPEIPPPPPAALPVISYFSPSSTSIKAGDSVELNWQTQNADDVFLDPGGPVGKNGPTSVKPAVNTTYVLTARGAGTADRKSLTIRVEAIPVLKVAIDQFDAGPDTIQVDQTSKLFWATQNATDVSIDQGVGTGLGPSGSRPVKPSQTTTYTLTAKGPTGDFQKKTVMVTVISSVRGSKCIDRFKDAYGTCDVNELKKAWPSVSDTFIKKYRDSCKGVQAITLDEQCSEIPAMSQDTARYQCRETMTYTKEGKRQPPLAPVSFEFACKKNGDSWVVESRAVK